MKQKTLRDKVTFEGIGVHLGVFSKVTLNPADVNTGIVFSSKKSLEKIVIGSLVPEDAIHASVLKSSNFIVSTIEHLMAVITVLGLDNVLIEMEGVEVPILDGSSLPFVQEIEKVGLVDQSFEKRFITPLKKIDIKDENEGRHISIAPAEYKDGILDKDLYFSYEANFKQPLIGKNSIKGVLSKTYFKEEIAPARTFGFLEQLPFLRRHGLARGSSLGNTVVINDEGFLNERRFEDEFVRHKLLDLVGDLALLGKSLSGFICAQNTGHNFNRRVIEHYIKNPDSWKLI